MLPRASSRIRPRWSAPWAGRVSATAGTGVPEWRVGADVSKGFAAGSLLVAVHGRRADDWTSPAGEVFNSGYRDVGTLAKVTHTVGGGFLSAGYQGDGGRDIERPRNNSRIAHSAAPASRSPIARATARCAGIAATLLPRTLTVSLRLTRIAMVMVSLN